MIALVTNTILNTINDAWMELRQERTTRYAAALVAYIVLLVAITIGA